MLNNENVLQYIKENPDFLIDNSAVLLNKPSSTAVVDFNSVLFSKLREQNKIERNRVNELINLNRDNYAVSQRIQECVLSAVASNSMSELLDVIYTDWATLLEVDIIKLIVETETTDTIPLKGMIFTKNGKIDELLEGNDFLLCDNGTIPEIFGSRQNLVKSYALGKLYLGKNRPNAVIAFGVSNVGEFSLDKETNGFQFLCHFLSYVVKRWLILP